MDFNEFINQYPEVEFKEIPKLGDYEDDLPLNFVQFLKKNGIGSYMNGFLWLCNPSELMPVLGEFYDDLSNKIPFARTAFGDILMIQDGEHVKRLDVRFGKGDILSTNIEFFFGDDLTYDELLKRELYYSMYNEALSKLGPLSPNECYGYVPALALGGKEGLDSLQKVNFNEHLSILANLVSPCY